MKNITTRLIMVGIFGACAAAWGQGSLTPPGAPAPTMKTLDQVEPRIPISSAGYTISHPGSYYLTTNLIGDSLTIVTSNVTLDLMGYAIVGTNWNAIDLAGNRVGVHVRNGTVSAVKGNGIDFSLSSSNAAGVIENLRVVDCEIYGIVVGGGFTVRGCQVQGCQIGIGVVGDSQVIGCTISQCATGLLTSGSGAYIADNIVKGNQDNYALSAGDRLNILLCEIPETIEWPCSVKLAGTLTCTQTGTNGITVAADNVTIDLAGHTLVGPGADSGHGIYQDSDYRNLRVFNGKAVDWGGNGNAGIYARGKSAVLSDLQALSNYCGIVAGYGSRLSSCTAGFNVNCGILADIGSTLSGCAAYKNGADGIFADIGSTLSSCSAGFNGGGGMYAGGGSTLSGCTASYNADDGIYAGYGSTLSGCTAYNNSDHGISAGSGSRLSGCAASYNWGDGIHLAADSHVVGCVCDNNGGGDGAGIHVTGGGNRIEGNNCTDNDRGIDVDVSTNLIVKNTCSGNTTNYDIVANNAVGTITNTPVGAGPWDNFDL